MSKKKQKGTKIDLTKILDEENSNGLPTKPRERDPNDKGRFQRGKGKKGYNSYNQGGKGYNRYLCDQMIREGKTKYEIEDKWAKIENKFGKGRKNSRFDSLKSQLSQRQEVEVDKVAQQIIEGKAKAKEQEELALKKSKMKKDKDKKKKK